MYKTVYNDYVQIHLDFQKPLICNNYFADVKCHCAMKDVSKRAHMTLRSKLFSFSNLLDIVAVRLLISNLL